MIKYIFLILSFNIIAAELPTEAPVKHGYYKIEIDGVFTNEQFSSESKADYSLQYHQLNNPDSDVRLIPDWYKTVQLTQIPENLPEPPKAPRECTLTINEGQDIQASLITLQAEESLCLNDGDYVGGVTVPSDVSLISVNIGGAHLKGGDTDWEAVLRMNGTGSIVDGLKVSHPDGLNSDACYISGEGNTMRNTSCSHGGPHKHKIPLKVTGNTEGIGNHLIEDSWFYGEGRYVVQCFKGTGITFRRNVARWDSTAPNMLTEPNAAFSIYNCADTTVENNISLDFGESDVKFGGDFYSPHNYGEWNQGNKNNHFLGNIVVNHDPENLNNRAFRADSTSSAPNTGLVIKDFYMRDSIADFVIHNSYKPVVIEDCERVNVTNIDPNIECNGAEFLRYQDREKTTTPLFPLSNEFKIKQDMCAPDERQSDWCLTDLSLSEYIDE